MLKIRNVLILMGMLLSPAASADVQVSIGIGLPQASIGINVPAYPHLVVVPGYPVYYAPQLQANFFFYDGMYWVYQDDYWYASSWYNGPWWIVGPEIVPVYVLRIPVHYYRHPPSYFRGWRSDAPPRWGDRWGRDWEQSRTGWNRWDSRFAPAPAPLPVYQRQYLGERYPRQVEQQYELHQQNYRYQPHEPVVRKHYEEQAVQKGGADVQRSSPDSAPPARPEAQERRQPSGPVPREQALPGSQEQEHSQQGKDEPKQGRGQGTDGDQGQRPGQGQGKDQRQGQGPDREQEQGGWDRYRTQ